MGGPPRAIHGSPPAGRGHRWSSADCGRAVAGRLIGLSGRYSVVVHVPGAGVQGPGCAIDPAKTWLREPMRRRWVTIVLAAVAAAWCAPLAAGGATDAEAAGAARAVTAPRSSSRCHARRRATAR